MTSEIIECCFFTRRFVIPGLVKQTIGCIDGRIWREKDMKKKLEKSNYKGLKYISILSLVIIVFLPLTAHAANIDLLQQFDMEQVTITDPYHANALNKEIAYLQAIDRNRLLVGFRQAAGLSTSYSLYGGWENSLIQGHTMGHYMTALAQAYKNTRSNATVNADLKNRIDTIISELLSCQNKNGNGYLFATPVTQFDVVEGKVSGSSWVPWYTMHKIMSGLISVYKLEGNSTALTIAGNLGNWIYNRVNAWDSATQSKVLGVEYGGMNDCLYELYKLTNNANHLAAAHKFDETSFFNTIASGSNVLPGKHANTQFPKFIGALNRYRTLGSGESSYLTAAQQFWAIVVRDHTYVTGGNSQSEFFRTAGQLNAYRDNVNNETCNSYNMMKLTQDLFKVTGDIKYADFYERAYINEILTSQNPQTGMATYFKPMGTGYFKVFSSQFDHFWCCTGTGMENFSKLNDNIYFNNGADLYVNMYISSTLNWSEKGLSLTQQANIPLSNIVTFTINSAPATAVKIKFRSPNWVAAGQIVTVKVNDSGFSASNINGYLDVNRVWAAGDKIELTIPMEVQVSRCTDNQNVVAFTYGPIVLSAGLGTASMTTSTVGVNVTVATKNVTVKETINIYSSISSSINNWLDNIRTNLVQTPGKVEFNLKNTDADGSLVFTPHYQRYTDRYGIYFTLAMVSGGPTPGPTAVPTAVPTSGPTPGPTGVVNGSISIACGNSSAVGNFQPDQYYSGGSTFNNTNTIDVSSITDNPPPAALFNTIPGFASGSSYAVTLYFAETYLTSSGGRLFDVSINGSTALASFDIYASSGGQNKAIARSFTTTADASGQIVIQFTAVTENPKICGISINPGSNNGTIGDVNGSGTIDIVDALLIAQYYVGLNPAGFVVANADVNCTSTIDIVDALLVAQYYVGLINELC
jgi:DUF1680 family protein